MRQRIPRWNAPVLGSLLLVAGGILTSSSGLLVAAVIPLCYLLYASLTVAVVPSSQLVIERSISPAQPLPGDVVTVTLGVEHVGERSLPDLRIVDGTPRDLTVESGSPRAGCTLRADTTTAFSYTLTARRGTHEFDPLEVRSRSLSAGALASESLEATGARTIRCESHLSEHPPIEATNPSAGTVSTDSPGAGIEFHTVREYRPGDPVSRVDWRQYAKTGQLSTIDYRETQAATVVLVVDARETTNRSPAPGQPTGRALSTYAAAKLLPALLAAGHDVTVAALGLDSDSGRAGQTALIDALSGPTLQAATTVLFDAVSAGTLPDAGAIQSLPTRHSGAPTHRQLCEQLPSNAQILLFTPAIDDMPVTASNIYRAHGHHVTVVSPDITDRSSEGSRLARIERRTRLSSLRRTETTVHDWQRSVPISIVLGEITANR